MSRTPIGARVGAILSSTNTEVHLLGFGVYDGEQDAPFGPMGAPMSLIDDMKRAGKLSADWAFKNPRITLDDGRVVWGCQCWWGPEDVIRKRIEGLSWAAVTELIKYRRLQFDGKRPTLDLRPIYETRRRRKAPIGDRA